MGLVAEAVERSGGSISRVFGRAELPLRLVERPEQIILLRDQLALVECAAREIGDDALPLRLSLEAGFGTHVGSAPNLEEAIERCNAGIGAMLQSATQLRLSRSRDQAVWSYEISDSARVGRQKNELLAIGYMVDLMRCFLGKSGVPFRVAIPGVLQARAQMQDLLNCDITCSEKAAVIFSAEALEAENPVAVVSINHTDSDVPEPGDLTASVEHLVRLGLLDRRPNIDWVSRRLKTPKRTLQRRLSAQGQSYEAIKARVVREQAETLLKSSDLSVSEIAFELGYTDPAHFTRAVIGWTGRTPRAWRRKMIEMV
jgi:AraC-like DNA-binding protein